MGQYYKLVNFDKKEFVAPWLLDCGAKLTEWSYNRAPMACALMNLVAGRWKGDRVYVVGDYTDLENTSVNWYEACKEISNEVGVDAIYSYATANFKDISSEVDAEFNNWKRIYNHYTKQYIDLSKCPIEWVWWDEEIKEAVVSSFAPLGLLLAMGNGRGSGDYHGHNADLVGSWCNFTKYIEISNDECILEGYEEFAPDFTENDSLIPYTKAEEMMNAVRKEHKHEKIINGRKYDTETAKEIGYWSNGYPCSDFNHYKETLYLKKTGEYFLYGEGGALTEYARSVCGGSTGGSRIIPLTEEDVKEWAMEHLECDEYEALFGEVEE